MLSGQGSAWCGSTLGVTRMSPLRRCVSGAAELRIIHTALTSAAEPAVPYRGAESPAPLHKRKKEGTESWRNLLKITQGSMKGREAWKGVRLRSLE